MRKLAWHVVLSLSVALLGCSDEMLDPAPIDPSGSGGQGGSATGGSGGNPAQPPGDPQPLPVSAWMVAHTFSSNDNVVAAVEDGSFALPPQGSYLGQLWNPVVPGDDFSIMSTNRDLLYAAALVTPPDGHRIFARGDTVISFYVDNVVRQPGDFYHSRRMRAPLTTSDGEHLVLARALGRRNAPEIELWSTDAELVLNTADVTAPSLVATTTDAQFVGVPVLVMRDTAVTDLSAKVLDDALFEETTTNFDSLAPGAVTQLSFLLQTKAPVVETADPLTVTIALESPSLMWSYTAQVEVPTVASGSRYRRTRRSNVDGSTQYYAVMPPTTVQPATDYGLIMSLHGASVEASGQASSYSPKDWTYLIAPTNRRPFGFDWEEWGRLDALEALDDAMAFLPIDATRVHLAGHSMGGHGSWHVGVHFSDRFGVIAPSAGWISFETYGGSPHPTGTPIGRARNAGQTLDYVDNLADNSVYIIHGSADNNVPVSHGQQMFATLGPITPALVYHEEPGAGHWWDNDPNEEGADCVDWEPMISVAEARTLDPTPLDFTWRSVAPWVNPTRSFVTVQSAASPMDDFGISSASGGNQITLTTTNVRSMILDGALLTTLGITTVDVDGTPVAVVNGPIAIGPQTGKTPALYGPLNQVFHKPFCFVWEDGGPRIYRDYAAYLLSWWAVIGNGHGCGVPMSALTDDMRQNRNLIFLGMADPGGLPITWTTTGTTVNGQVFDDSAMAFVAVGSNGRLAAYFSVATGSEYLLFRYMPFSSRAGMPDFLVWDSGGSVTNGFFDADWQVDPSFATGL